jgi:hypothetical protein
MSSSTSTQKSIIQEAKAGLYELTTLGKWGRQLPIGLLSPDGTKLSKSFTLRPFTFEEELRSARCASSRGCPPARSSRSCSR